jgi:hypothetical protein
MTRVWYLTQYPKALGDQRIVREFRLPFKEGNLKPLYDLFGFDPEDPGMVVIKEIGREHEDAMERLVGEKLDREQYSYFVECYSD